MRNCDGKQLRITVSTTAPIQVDCARNLIFLWCHGYCVVWSAYLGLLAIAKGTVVA